MKILVFVFLVTGAVLSCNGGEMPQAPKTITISGKTGSSAVDLPQSLRLALTAVLQWWTKHHNGFPEYTLRAPDATWKAVPCSNSNRPEAICLSEANRQPEARPWYATTSISSPNVFEVGAPEGAGYSITWVIIISDGRAGVAQVRLDVPTIEWIDPTSLQQ